LTDIVERLRNEKPSHINAREAAAEIERLRKLHEELSYHMNNSMEQHLKDHALWRNIALEEAAEVVDDMLLADLGEEIAAAIRARTAQHVVHSAPQSTMEGLFTMPDLADFADELEALITEHLDAGVERHAIKATLDAKLREMEDEEAAAAEEPPAEDGENV
jgi:hypothetical protein